MDEMDNTKTEKDEVIFPADGCLSSCSEVYPQHIREEECCERIGGALRTEMRGEDFGCDSVLIDIDECSVTVGKLHRQFFCFLGVPEQGGVLTRKHRGRER